MNQYQILNVRDRLSSHSCHVRFHGYVRKSFPFPLRCQDLHVKRLLVSTCPRSTATIIVHNIMMSTYLHSLFARSSSYTKMADCHVLLQLKLSAKIRSPFGHRQRYSGIAIPGNNTFGRSLSLDA